MDADPIYEKMADDAAFQVWIAKRDRDDLAAMICAHLATTSRLTLEALRNGNAMVSDPARAEIADAILDHLFRNYQVRKKPERPPARY